MQKDYIQNIAEKKGNTKQWDFWLKPTETRLFARVRNPAICGGLDSINRSGPRLVASAEMLARVIWGEETGINVPKESWQPIM